jgi:hypothetical protein
LLFWSLLYNQRILNQMVCGVKLEEMDEIYRHEYLFVFVFPDL